MTTTPSAHCANHPDMVAGAYCRICGKPLCAACQRPAKGTIYCSEHAPASAAGSASYSPYTAPIHAPPHSSRAEPSPGLAFLLGFIPGVGAIYNGQYLKGFLHVVVLGVLISIFTWNLHGAEPLVGLLVAAWFFYMAFEAYHTAQKRRAGEPVDELSGLFSGARAPSRFPAGPVVLIAVGALFLLQTLDIVRIYQIFRYWPVALIALGVYLLIDRLSPSGRRP